MGSSATETCRAALVPSRLMSTRQSFVRVVSGGATVYGIASSGAVWVWGQNNVGQFGFGALTMSDRPIKSGITLRCISSTAANVEGLSEPDMSSVSCSP